MKFLDPGSNGKVPSSDGYDAVVPSSLPPYVYIQGKWVAREWTIESPTCGIQLYTAGSWLRDPTPPVAPVGTMPHVFWELVLDHRITDSTVRFDAHKSCRLYVPHQRFTLRACIDASVPIWFPALAGRTYRYRWAAAPSFGGSSEAFFSSGPVQVAAGATEMRTIPTGARSVYVALNSNIAYGTTVFRTVNELDGATTVLAETLSANKSITLDGWSYNYTIQNLGASTITAIPIWRIGF